MISTKILSTKHPAVRIYERKCERRISASARRISSNVNVRIKHSGMVACESFDEFSESPLINSNTGVRIDNTNTISDSIISERLRILGDISYE